MNYEERAKTYRKRYLQTEKAVGFFTAGKTPDKLTSSEIFSISDVFLSWEKGKYAINDVRRHVGQVWRCCQAHDNANNPDIEPGKSPAQWAPYHATEAKYAMPYVKPTGAHDAYLKGEVMIWTDGKIYRSILATANTYTPAEYSQGWEVIAL